MKNFLYKLYLYFFYKKRNYKDRPERILESLLESQYWDREKTEAHQLKLINELIFNAKENTTYYKNISGQIREPFRSLGEFVKEFPVLSKKIIVENDIDLINHKESSRIHHSTSGSTGNPMIIEISPKAEAFRNASMMRFLNWWGLRANDNHVLIWGVKKTQKIRIWTKIKDKIRNRLVINVFDLNEHTIDDYFKTIEKHKPAFIRGYKSGVFKLAMLMHQRNLKFEKPFLKVAIVTSEVLLQSEREFIEKILKCKVANEYGAAEAGLFALECPKGNMHINEETVFIATDEENNTIVTELHNNGMPLINYRNNDRITISNKFCACGRTMRIVEEIDGRIDDFIECTDGTHKNHLILYYIFKELGDVGFPNSVTQYRIKQRQFNFLVELIPNTKYNKNVANYIMSRMREEIGEEIQIEIKLVKDIKREKSGKLRFFIREKEAAQ